jgi:hemerythrin
MLLSQTTFTWGDPTAYQWDSSLETGYDKIDKQHKQLVAAVNNLMEAGAGGKGDAAVLETLDFLTGYAIKHFADEEQLQFDYDYPDYLNHKRLHDEFKVVVGELTKRVSKEGPTAELIDIVSSTVGSWLLNHIKGDDFRMAAFIKAADAASVSEMSI